jgi:hypothetical protein
MMTNNYQFLILLNVIIFSWTGFIAVSSLYNETHMVLEQEDEGSKTPNKIIRAWLFLYAFVGSQLGWRLRLFLVRQILYFNCSENEKVICKD